MAALWYCKIGDRQYGPLEADQLGTMAQKGKLTPDSLVRRGEDGRWVVASQVQGLRFPGSSPELPKAKPLPPTPPPEPPAAPPIAPPVASVPIATAVAAAVAAPTPVVQTAAPAYDPADLTDDKDKGLSRSAVVLIVAGFACVLLATVGVVVGMQFFGDDDSKDEAVAKSDADDDGESAQEHDPELMSLKTESAEPPAKQSAAQAPTPTKDPLRGYKVLKWAEWHGVRLPGVAAITLTSVGLDENSLAATGGPSGDDKVFNAKALGLDPTKKANNGIGRPTRENNVTDAEADQPNRVFVRIQVTNLAPEEPMTYVSFNGQAGADAAVLADGNGNLCRLLPLAETPEATRIDQQILAPGESVSDLLIFEAPKGGFESLRVLVPLTAVGKANYLGFEITGEQLGLVEPEPKPESGADDAEEVATKKPSGGTGAPMREKDNEKTKDEKAEFEDLQRSINAGNDQ